MRILHVVGSSSFGGAYLVIEALVDGAVQNGWEVDVLTTDDVASGRLRAKGAGVVDMPCIWRDIRPLRDMWGLLRLWWFLSHAGYDVVHTHTSKGGFVGRLAAWGARVPAVVHTVHGYAFHGSTPKTQKRLWVLLERFAAAASDRVVTVSEFHAAETVDEGIAPSRKVVAIPNGLPSRGRTRDEEDPPTQGRETDRRPLLVALGRVAEQKGFHVLLDAVAAIRDTRPDLPLAVVIAGDGPQKRMLEIRAREMNLEPYVTFAGFVADPRPLLRKASLVVLPSLWEGLSIALLEAMHEGCAVLTTSIPSNVEVTEDGQCAALVRPGDASELADRIVQLLADAEERTRLGEKARERVETTYHEGRMKDSYMELYEDVLRSSRAIPKVAP